MEHRMTHRTVLGHFSEGHFGQPFRLEPVHALEFAPRGRVDHRRLFALQGLELLMNAVERRFGEPGADLARIAQLATVAVVQPQQQGTERAARALGIGVADDDELLAMLALELDPVAAAPGHIGRPEALADQPFHAHLAGAVE
ncbi:hypothetical protein D3C86_1474980 [compost metagenome]